MNGYSDKSLDKDLNFLRNFFNLLTYFEANECIKHLHKLYTFLVKKKLYNTNQYENCFLIDAKET
jgi:hypothetical protein